MTIDGYFAKTDNYLEAKLSQSDLECGFIYLSRGIPGRFRKSKVEAFSSIEMFQKLQGFAKQDIDMIFQDISDTSRTKSHRKKKKKDRKDKSPKETPVLKESKKA